MCGIAGFIDPSGGAAETKREILQAMTDRMRLRGPDGEGFFVDGAVHLGHRRLSILDLAGGAQPMARGALVVTFNGEIYNFSSLRAELERGGQRFVTRSDTEVLLAAHEARGDAAISALDGMFAYALWDGARRQLFVARDRFGKKPLYYFHDGKKFYFASTLSALLLHPAVPRAIDDDALDEYLALEYVVAPRTMLRGVKKLPPGSWLRFDAERGTCEVARYWSLRVAETADYADERAAADHLQELIEGAVARRMVADVPVGIFLSGGLDSSTVAAVAARRGTIRTFSVRFADPSFDESRFARRVAAHIGSEHQEAELTEADTLGIVGQLGEILDEPIGDGSIVPTYLLSRFARTQVTVALGGDGGDELFAGYPTYVAHRLAEWGARVLPLARLTPLLRRLVAQLPVSHDNFSFDFKLKKFLAGLDAPLAIRNTVWLGAYTLDGLARLRGRPLTDDPYVAPRACYVESGATHLERVMGQDVRLYMAHSVLAKVDRASMAASLEVRAPLLDTQVAEFAARLPMKWKLHGLDGKYLLKRVGERLLPRDIVHRQKKGFGMPTGRWLKGPLHAEARALLTGADSLAASGRVSATEVTRLLDEHRAGTVDHRQRLWTLLVMEQWRRAHQIGA